MAMLRLVLAMARLSRVLVEIPHRAPKCHVFLIFKIYILHCCHFLLVKLLRASSFSFVLGGLETR